MKLPRKRDTFKVSTEMSNLIKNLSGLDKAAFDARVCEDLQLFFGETRISWVPAPVVVTKTLPTQAGVLKIQDNQDRTIAFILLSKAHDKKNIEGQVPQEWPLIEKILSGLYQSARMLTEAKKLSYVDDVTHLYNQRYLHIALDEEIRKAQAENTEFSALFIDVDHFKNVNDSNGHQVGSHLLLQVSNILRQNIRSMDHGFRYGGDEFILLLSGSNKDSALAIGERIRNQVEKTNFEVDGRNVRLTLSIGVASFPEHAKTKEDIIRMADEAMYKSKQRNRNIVSVAS